MNCLSLAPKNLMPRDNVWMTSPRLQQVRWQTHRPPTLHTTTTGTRWVSYLKRWLCLHVTLRLLKAANGHTCYFPVRTCFWCFNLVENLGDPVYLFFPSLFLSSHTAAGDKTPGGSTTSMPSITSTTLLLQHDEQNPHTKTETQRKASFLTCLLF